MGKGGRGTPAANTRSKTNINNNAALIKKNPVYERQLKAIKDHPKYDEWISPFTPERVDPRYAPNGETVKFPTKSELRAVIPPHCFHRSLIKSMFYVIRDIAQGCALVYLVHNVWGITTDPPALEEGMSALSLAYVGKYLAWRLFWNVYAVLMTLAAGGLWVIGHECGHGAFSDYTWVNGFMGWLLHSALLVPFFSWAFSHAKHHRRTNDLVEGETHVPSLYNEVGLKEAPASSTATYERVPSQQVRDKVFAGGIGHFFKYFFYGKSALHEFMGDRVYSEFHLYYKIYLMWQHYILGHESTGHRMLGKDGKPDPVNGEYSNHFNPNGRLFPAKMYWKVFASSIGCGITASILGYSAYLYGLRAVWFWYGGPYMVIHAFLVGITWMQHADPTVPQFDADNWTWMKGALAGTIDRPMYWWINYASHNIATTHVVHHCFHEIPHYNAKEATAAVRAFLEPQGLYNYDPTPCEDALYKIAERCHFVDAMDDGVQYYQSLCDVPLSKTSQKEKNL